MADIGNMLFGTKPLPTVTTKDTTNSQYPSWYQNYLNSLLGKASSVAGEPYKAYGGPRIAAHSADTNAAFNQVRQGIGAYKPQFDAGSGMVAEAGRGFDQGELDQFMNPYVDQVVNRIGTLGARNLSENLLPQVNDSFIRSGQFGSRGNIDLTGRAIRDTQESVLAQQSSALASGFENQMKNVNAFRDRSLTAGQTGANLAQLGQGMNLQDSAALQGIGQAQEDKTQQSLNLGYQDFLEQRDYPRSQVDWLNSVFRGYQPPVSTTSTSTGPGSTSQMAPNTLAQVAGTALGIYGMGGFKKGGKVGKLKKRKPTEVPMKMPQQRGISSYQMAA
jgi:hypothetical protein